MSEEQDTVQCESCEEMVSIDSLTIFTYYNQIDYNLCIYCYEKRQERQAEYEFEQDKRKVEKDLINAEKEKKRRKPAK